jgi:tight adherence protein C
MDILNPVIEQVGANPVILFSVLIFFAVVLFVVGGAGVLAGGDPVSRRMRARVSSARPGASGKPTQPQRSKEFLRKLEKRATRDQAKVSIIRQRLIQAGYMGAHAVGAYYAARVTLACTLSILMLALFTVFGDAASTNKIMLIGVLGAMIGYFLPMVIVSMRVDRRQNDARIGFPDALDMLLVCVEAGLSLAAALNRVGQEIGGARPLLGEQFKLVALEMQAGKSREQALRNMADRIGIDEVRSLVTLLLQSEALGTSIALSLRVHADEMRRRRLVRAEEHANKLPAKMAIPLV